MLPLRLVSLSRSPVPPFRNSGRQQLGFVGEESFFFPTFSPLFLPPLPPRRPGRPSDSLYRVRVGEVPFSPRPVLKDFLQVWHSPRPDTKLRRVPHFIPYFFSPENPSLKPKEAAYERRAFFPTALPSVSWTQGQKGIKPLSTFPFCTAASRLFPFPRRTLRFTSSPAFLSFASFFLVISSRFRQRLFFDGLKAGLGGLDKCVPEPPPFSPPRGLSDYFRPPLDLIAFPHLMPPRLRTISIQVWSFFGPPRRPPIFLFFFRLFPVYPSSPFSVRRTPRTVFSVLEDFASLSHLRSFQSLVQSNCRNSRGGAPRFGRASRRRSVSQRISHLLQ